MGELISFSPSSASEIKHVEDRLGHDFRYAINSEKIRVDLGWSPEVSFESGLKETFDWYQENWSWLGGSI